MTGRGKRNEGFTLVEIVIAMTVLSIVVTILSGVFVTNADIFGSIVRTNDDVSDLRLASARMAIEIRSIRDRSSVQKATNSSLHFRNDDGDQVRLDYDPRLDELLLNARTLATDLSTCRFTYYDEQGRSISQPRINPETDIWSVEVELTAGGRGGPRVISRVYPRNFL